MMVLMMVEDILTRLGCELVATAATVDRAISLINSQIFDVAMLDVNLGGDNSYPVADLLTARGIPFLFATGYSDHGMREDYREKPRLKKPYRYEALVAMLVHLAASSAR